MERLITEEVLSAAKAALERSTSEIGKVSEFAVLTEEIERLRELFGNLFMISHRPKVAVLGELRSQFYRMHWNYRMRNLEEARSWVAKARKIIKEALDINDKRVTVLYRKFSDSFSTPLRPCTQVPKTLREITGVENGVGPTFYFLGDKGSVHIGPHFVQVWYHCVQLFFEEPLDYHVRKAFDIVGESYPF